MASLANTEMNTIREIEKINNEELERGIAGTSASWHTKYSNSAWVYIGNIDHELSEGDIICVMSQYGEASDCSSLQEECESLMGEDSF